MIPNNNVHSDLSKAVFLSRKRSGQFHAARRSVVMKWLVLLCFSCFRPAVGQDLQLVVPLGTKSPHIDGNLYPDEWSGANLIVLPDSSKFMFTRDPQHLYVALRLPRRSLGSLCIRKNNKVRILHASAALGIAVYIRNGNIWKLVEPFRFTLRETDDSEDIQQKRVDFLAKHGWVASTVHMGGNEPALEYKIRIDLFDPERPVLGVVAMPMESNPILMSFPENLDDGCSSLELVRGYASEQVQFNSAGWLQLKIEQ